MAVFLLSFQKDPDCDVYAELRVLFSSYPVFSKAVPPLIQQVAQIELYLSYHYRNLAC